MKKLVMGFLALSIIFTAAITFGGCTAAKYNRMGITRYSNNPNTQKKLFDNRKRGVGSAAYFNVPKLGQQKRGNAYVTRKKMELVKKNNGKWYSTIKNTKM
jgi:hypothetical protein